MKSTNMEYGNLPNSAKMENDERVGFETSGYIDKKGTPAGLEARFNYLPPGQDINDQYCADIRDLPMKRITAGSFPGDGWNGSNGSVVRKHTSLGGESDPVTLPLAK